MPWLSHGEAALRICAGRRRAEGDHVMTTERKRYRRKAGQPITAVRLDLDTPGLQYRKWDHDQFAKQGDWLVDNDGDVYTVEATTFAKTYRTTSPGRYEKTGFVWAERAAQAGRVATKEGHTAYAAGDWLVSNDEDGRDAYAMGAAAFERMYQPAEDD
jgi:hypothetical protein